jgi:TonB family protein
VKPPVLVSKVDASYPAEARRQRIQGVVIIEAVIDRDGRVDSPRVLRSVDPLLDAAALEAVRFWRYQPATRDGKPVRVFLTVTTSFNLPSSAPGAADAPLRVGGDVKPPVLVFKVDPEYPAEARRQRIRGLVVIEAVIDSDGRVHSTRLLQSANPLLDEAALEAVRLWRYQPATRDGKPVRVFLIVTTSFNLH